MLGVLQGDLEDAVQLEAQVAGGAPALAADLGAPLPDVAHAVLAEVEDDVRGCCLSSSPISM